MCTERSLSKPTSTNTRAFWNKTHRKRFIKCVSKCVRICVKLCQKTYLVIWYYYTKRIMFSRVLDFANFANWPYLPQKIKDLHRISNKSKQIRHTPDTLELETWICEAADFTCCCFKRVEDDLLFVWKAYKKLLGHAGSSFQAQTKSFESSTIGFCWRYTNRFEVGSRSRPTRSYRFTH